MLMKGPCLAAVDMIPSTGCFSIRPDTISQLSLALLLGQEEPRHSPWLFGNMSWKKE